MKNKIFIALYLLIINTYAQIEVFSPNSSVDVHSHKSRKFEWSLGVNPCIMAKGMFGVNSELGMNNMFTAQIGAGITTYDYIYESLGMELSGNSVGDNDSHYSPLDEEYHESQTGAYGDFNLKFYPAEHDDFTGFYISPGLRLRTYKCTGTVYNYSSSEYKVYDMSYSMVDPNLKLGWQISNIFYDEILIDYYLGIARSHLYRNGYKDIENALGQSDTEAVSSEKVRIIPVIGFNLCYKF